MRSSSTNPTAYLAATGRVQTTWPTRRFARAGPKPDRRRARGSFHRSTTRGSVTTAMRSVRGISRDRERSAVTPCARRAGAFGKVEQRARRYRSDSENDARITAASRSANASKRKHRRGLTPVEFPALRIDVLHVENILEQHTRHLADTDCTAL